MIAEFIHFYPAYTVESVLKMYAVSFYAMLGSLYRVRAMEDMNQVNIALSAGSTEGYSRYMTDARKRAGGAHQILEEVRRIENV